MSNNIEMKIDSEISKNLSLLESSLGRSFSDKQLLLLSIIHRSYGNENREFHKMNNEKLELLGDSVLSLIATEYLFKRFVNMSEGDIVKIKSALVSEASLADFAKKLNIGSYLYISKGEEITGGRSRSSMLADAFEAILGAMYVDSDLESVRKFLIPLLSIKIEEINSDKNIFDYKTSLQEYMQSKHKEIPEYIIKGSHGPDHDKVFTIAIKLQGEYVSEAEGKSKKEAEQKAARIACEHMNIPMKEWF